MDAVWEGEGGMNGECNINIHRRPYVKQIAGEKLLCNTGSPAWLSLETHLDMKVGGREAQEGRDIYVYVCVYVCVYIYIYTCSCFTLLYSRNQ